MTYRTKKLFFIVFGVFFVAAAFLLLPPATQIRAAIVNVVPNAKGASDNTTEAISEITTDNSAVNPDTLSAVVASDGTYTVDKNNVMSFTTFDVSSIPSGSTITGAVLHFQFGVENGYNGTNPIRYNNGAGLTTTGITPTDITGFSADQSFNLFTAGVDTLSEIQNVDIEFTNNDGAQADAVHFDYIWITVTYTPPTTTLGDGTDPGNASLSPGGSITDLDSFTFQASAGTDSVTALIVTLASGTSGGLSEARITSNDGVTTYFLSASNPASDTVSFSGGTPIPITTSSTQFKVRITPKSHANMPAPPGSTYSVTGTVTSFTSTNSQAGSDTDSATVTIDNQSPSNITGASDSAGDSQVSLSWTNPADSDFHSSIVLRRAGTAVSDTPTEGTTYIVGNAVGASTVACVVASPTASCTDTGLTNGTAYHYRIYTRDSNVNYSATGVVPTGSPFTPTAAADTTAPAAVSDLATANPSNNSIDLSWTAPGDDNNTGTASTYDIRYSTSLITAGNFNSATQVTGEPTPSIAGSAEAMTVSGLSPSTTYYFAMKTSDEVPNTSTISNVPSGTTTATPDTTAPAASTDLATGAVTSSSVVLSWTAPGDDGSSGTAASYDVRYSTSLITSGNFDSATQATGEPTPSVAGSSESMTVSGLSASTLYYFAIKTLDEVPNTSNLSNIVNTTTSAGADVTAPAAITDLALSNPAASSLDLSWTAPGDDGSSGTATSYDIRYSTSLITDGNFNSATQVTGEPTPSIAGSAESMTVSGLSANTTYYFALKTSDEVSNTSSLSNVPSATTAAATDTTVPAAITDLALSNATVSSIKLIWTAPGDDGSTGTAASYDIRFSTSPITTGNFSSATQAAGEPTPDVAGTSQNMTVTGLTSDTTYYFAMKTSDEVPNASDLSNTPSLATISEIVSPVFIPPPGTGGVLPTRVVFSGRAYPSGRVKFFRRSQVDISLGNTYVLDTETTADSNGKFEKQFQALLQGTYFFAVEANDKDGRSSGILSFAANLIASNELESSIFMPPTVDFESAAVTRSKDLKIIGYAAPGNTIEAELDKILRYQTKAKTDGSYEIFVNTSRFSLKDHFVRAWQVDDAGLQSPISPMKTFRITLLSNPKADLNNDGAMTITDWSIFLFRWRAKDANLKKLVDLDGNGKTDIADLSIFLKAIKGL